MKERELGVPYDPCDSIPYSTDDREWERESERERVRERTTIHKFTYTIYTACHGVLASVWKVPVVQMGTRREKKTITEREIERKKARVEG